MTIEFQNSLQIIVVGIYILLVLTRFFFMKSRKVGVFVLDSQITKTQLINGFLFFSCLALWMFEAVVYGLSVNYHIPLKSLHTPILQHVGFKYIAILFLLPGLAILALSLFSFGDSWRIGIDREKSGKLITTGVFAWSRNPIYVGLNLLVFGTFLLQGVLIFLLLTIVIAVTLHIQIVQEEKFLVEIYGDDYKDYCRKVGRYFIL